MDRVSKVVGETRTSHHSSRGHGQPAPVINQSRSKRQPRYYALVPERNFDLERVVESTLNPFNISDTPNLSSDLKSAQRLWDQLKDGRRITPHPHVTITHTKERRTEESVWIACENIVNQLNQQQDNEKESEYMHTREQEKVNQGTGSGSSTAKITTLSRASMLEFDVTELVWNDRVMALAVQNLRSAGHGSVGLPTSSHSPLASMARIEQGPAPTTKKKGKGSRNENPREGTTDEFLSNLPDNVKNRLHITVGTRDPKIPAVEAKELIQNWRSGERDEGMKVIPIQGITFRGKIRGLMG